jgi:hypothetical protein
MIGATPPLASHVFMAQYLMEYKGNFNFHIYLRKDNFLKTLNKIRVGRNYETSNIPPAVAFFGSRNRQS